MGNETKCLNCGKLTHIATNRYCSLRCNLEHNTDRTVDHNGCREWIGILDNYGYGSVYHDGDLRSAKNCAYLIYKGSIPEGKHVISTCNNSKCVNPDHLVLCNIQDKIVRVNCKHCGVLFVGNNSNVKYCSVECNLEHNTDKISDPNGCHTWTSTLHHTGYGLIWANGKYVKVCEYVYEQNNPKVPEDSFVKHICNNRACVNPEHLVLDLLKNKTILNKCIYCETIFESTSGIPGYCSIHCAFKHNTDETSDPNGCWLWKGTVDCSGYGLININCEQISAHRYSYEYHNKTTIPEGMFILHSCDNPRCVNSEHLRVGTHLENIQDKLDRDRQPKGEDHGRSKLSDADVTNIFQSVYESNTTLADRYNVTPETIRHIRTGRTWTHLTGKFDKSNIPNFRTKLTDEQVKEIYTSDEPASILAKRYNVVTGTIHQIRNDIGWTHITKNLTRSDNVQVLRRNIDEEVVKDIYLSNMPAIELARKYDIDRSTVRDIRNGTSRSSITRHLVKSTSIQDARIKLTDDQVKDIYLSDQPVSVLTDRYKVGVRTIYDIIKGVTWKHITRHLNKSTKQNLNTKLTEEQIKHIYTSDLSTRYLMDKYNVSESTIRTIRNGSAWSDITKHLTRSKNVDDPRYKLTNEQVEEIYLSIEPTSVLAKIYNIDPSTIKNIRSNKSRTDVTRYLTRTGDIQGNPSVLTEEQVADIYTSTKTTPVLAKQYDVSETAIRNIRTDKTWINVTKDLIKPDNRDNNKCKLTKDQVKEIYFSTDNDKLLAEKYNVSPNTIRDVKNGKRWGNITTNFVDLRSR